MDDPSADRALVVLTTLADRKQASALVRSLVSQRLVACGTLIEGVTSIFRWEGKVNEEVETVVLLKTTATRWDALREAILAEHPYDEPEVLALPVTAGSASYLSWVSSATT